MAYNLTCTVSKTVGGLSNPPIAVWTTGKGAPASTGNKTTVFTTITDTEAISIMMFDPLMTSHEGIYICVGNLTSPALETPLMPSISEENHVQSKINSVYSQTLYQASFIVATFGLAVVA